MHDGGALGGVELENGAVVAVRPHPDVAVAVGFVQAGAEQIAAEGPADLDPLQGGRGGEGQKDRGRIPAVVGEWGGEWAGPRGPPGGTGPPPGPRGRG